MEWTIAADMRGMATREWLVHKNHHSKPCLASHATTYVPVENQFLGMVAVDAEEGFEGHAGRAFWVHHHRVNCTGKYAMLVL